MAESFDTRKINEALELLNQAAKERLTELQDIVSDKYSTLRAAIGGTAEKLRHRAHAAFDQGREKVGDLASGVDSNIHKNPWPYLGGTALGFLVLGFSLGRARR